MAVQGIYSGLSGASRSALRASLRSIVSTPGALTAEQQADRLADAIFDWLRGARVVVQVQPADLGIQTTTAPGSPTGPPAATMELLGQLTLQE